MQTHTREGALHKRLGHGGELPARLGAHPPELQLERLVLQVVVHGVDAAEGGERQEQTVNTQEQHSERRTEWQMRGKNTFREFQEERKKDRRGRCSAKQGATRTDGVGGGKKDTKPMHKE